MANLFDSTSYPTVEPSVVYAGNRWAWVRDDLNDYGSGYSLSYELTLEGGSTPVSLSATYSDSKYTVEVSAATTAAYTVGTYQWVALMTRDSDSERVQIASGTIEVKADPAVSTADPRSDVKVILDAIKAVIAQRATQDQMAYTINGRTLERTPIKDLLLLRDVYQREYNSELKAERIAKGLNSGNQIRVRLS